MMESLSWQAWVTLGVIGVALVALVRDWARPHLVLLASLVPLLVLGVLEPEEAFAGLSNSAVLTVGSLFVVAAGVQATGALAFVDRLLFPRSPSLRPALLRLMGSTVALSAFLNNTPIVAMLIPRVQAWSERTGVPASKLLIPLSYAAIVGGATTLIGTSTNLLVSGLMEEAGHPGLGLFTFTAVGLPAAACVVAYFVLVGHRFLPSRGGVEGPLEAEARGEGPEDTGAGTAGYLFEVDVEEGSPLAGQTVEEAGLRALGDAFLVHLSLGDDVRTAAPDAVLREGDRLLFTGARAAYTRLLERPGLTRPLASVEAGAAGALQLYEAVVAPSSALVGRTLKEMAFRERYQGVVLGIWRRDARMTGRLGRTPIEGGDLLLVEATPDFDRRWHGRRDEFYLVAPLQPEPPRVLPAKAPVALGILGAVVAGAALGLASIVTTAFVGGLAMIATGCLSSRSAARAVDLPVLVVIAAALGLGRAIEETGLAAFLASGAVGPAAWFGPVGALAAVFLITSLLTELVTNNAAAALMVAVGLGVAEQVGAPPEAFGLAVALAASASFLTPIGYQTNLMVMAPGGYRFADFVRSGLFVNAIVAAVSITMIALIWL